MDYVIGGVLMLAILAGLGWAWADMARRPSVWNRRLSDCAWARATFVVTAGWMAAVIGTLLAGRDDLAGVTAVFGIALSLLVGIVWTMARTFTRDP